MVGKDAPIEALAQHRCAQGVQFAHGTGEPDAAFALLDADVDVYRRVHGVSLFTTKVQGESTRHARAGNRASRRQRAFTPARLFFAQPLSMKVGGTAAITQ